MLSPAVRMRRMQEWYGLVPTSYVNGSISFCNHQGTQTADLCIPDEKWQQLLDIIVKYIISRAQQGVTANSSQINDHET